MNYAGEYAQPLVRTTVVQVVAMNGYSTARLRAQEDPAATTLATDQLVEVLLENTGDTTVTIQLLEANVYDATSVAPNPVRDATALGAAITVIPRGRVSYTVTTQKRYLEVSCTAGGPSNVRVQLTSQVRWHEQGFDKIRDATIYPAALWQA